MITRNSRADFPNIQYANDIVIVMPASSYQLLLLKNLIMHFTTFTRLRVNYGKYTIVPISTPQPKMIELASIMGYSIGLLPI